MPIYRYSDKAVIGVAQLVNKRHRPFNESDEKLFRTFAVYCGLAIHYAQEYERRIHEAHQHQVALEVLSYHTRPSEAEMEEIRRVVIPRSGKCASLFSFCT